MSFASRRRLAFYRAGSNGAFLWALLQVSGCRTLQPIVVVAMGDLSLAGRSEQDRLVLLAPQLEGDLRFANLEGPLSTRLPEQGLDSAGRPTGGPIRFAAPPRRAAWLRGRLEVVSLANNHALDQGVAGRVETERTLASVGVAAASEEHDAVLTKKGQRVIVVARSLPAEYSGAAADELVAHVARARRKGMVLVSVHWGRSGSLLPDPEQRQLAARLINAGASAVLGHGPHTLQGVEWRGRGQGQSIIAYSLGNLAFGCQCTDVLDAYALRFVVDADGAVTSIAIIPLEAGLGGAPARLSGDPGLRELIAQVSHEFGTTLTINGNDLVSKASHRPPTRGGK